MLFELNTGQRHSTGIAIRPLQAQNLEKRVYSQLSSQRDSLGGQLSPSKDSILAAQRAAFVNVHDRKNAFTATDTVLARLERLSQ